MVRIFCYCFSLLSVTRTHRAGRIGVRRRQVLVNRKSWKGCQKRVMSSNVQLNLFDTDIKGASRR